MPTAKKTTSAEGGAAKKTTAKSSTTKASSKTTASKTTKTKRAPNPAFMKPLQPSAELAVIVGKNPLPRTEVTKKVWDYIKGQNLQDQNNRRMINPDDKLRPVLSNKKQVSMFEMTKLINEHLK